MLCDYNGGLDLFYETPSIRYLFHVLYYLYIYIYIYELYLKLSIALYMCWQFGLFPLHKAACKGHTDTCKVLVAAGADANKGINVSINIDT